jgi:uncharacterized glyoxalase superfamily protein PhnB
MDSPTFTLSAYYRDRRAALDWLARARAAGAGIAAEPSDQFYGDRTYRAVDPEGHVWTFARHVRDVTRAEAEAAIGVRIEAPSWA